MSRGLVRGQRGADPQGVAEFAHEFLIEPQVLGTEGEWGRYALAVGAPGSEPATEYRFRTRRLARDTWDIGASSLEKRVAGATAPLDALAFVIELGQTSDRAIFATSLTARGDAPAPAGPQARGEATAIAPRTRWLVFTREIHAGNRRILFSRMELRPIT